MGNVVINLGDREANIEFPDILGVPECEIARSIVLAIKAVRYNPQSIVEEMEKYIDEDN